MFSKKIIRGSNEKAFSFIELLITIAVIAIVGTIGFINLYGYREVKQLDSAAQETIASLRYAQNNAITQENASQWGVYVSSSESSPDSYFIYYGNGFSGGTVTATSTYPSSIKLNVAKDVNFAKMTGLPPLKNIFVLYLVSNPSINRVITIDSNGSISVASNIPQQIISNITTIVASNPGFSLNLKLSPDNLANISYYDTTDNYLKFIRCNSDDCINHTITPIDLVGSVSGTGFKNSLALGSDNLPRISYYDGPNGDLKFVRCKNIDCTDRVIEIIDSADNVGWFNSLAFGTNGLARISYYDVTNRRLKYVRCTGPDLDCTNKVITVVDSSGNTGFYSSLAIGTNDQARIAYLDSTSRTIKLARCTSVDFNCTDSIITTVGPIGDIGWYFPFVLNNNDYPRITHSDYIGYPSPPPIGYWNSNLIVCADFDCISKNILNLDRDNITGASSVALNSQGFLNIAYESSINGDIKVVQCLNDDCSQRSATGILGNAAWDVDIDLINDDLARIVFYDSADKAIKYIRQQW